MAKKLYGAAAAARKKRLAKMKRRRSAKRPAAKRNPPKKRKSAKRSAAAKKGAATRKRKAAARSAAAKKAYRSRKRRKNPHKKRKRKASARRAPVRRRRRARANPHANPHAKRRRKRKAAKRKAPVRRRTRTRRRKRRNPPRSTVYSMRRSRRSIKNRRKTGLAAAYKQRFRMRSNPSTFTGAVKAALPVAASLYASRVLVNTFGPKIPMIGSLGQFAKPAQAAAVLALAHFATKRVKPLKKWRGGIMVGTAINLIDTVVSTFAPDQAKMFGLADSGIYDEALGDYVQVGDYVTIGDAPPIDDDITLSDYVEIGDVEEELGQLQEELGVEEELGELYAPTGALPENAWQRPKLGGVTQSSMLKQLPTKQMEAPIPARSFTKKVPQAGAGYDKPGVVYTGIFSGGFGC